MTNENTINLPLIVVIARAGHEANRAYSDAMGDTSQPAWEQAEQWQRDSAIAGVEAICRSPHTSPQASHENWLAHKRAEGWKWGPKKDPAKKEHPCFVPYEELPLYQKKKDHLFHSIVVGALDYFGLRPGDPIEGSEA